MNLAARALDGDEIYVPAQGESRTRVPAGGGSARRGRRPSRPHSRRSASADAIAHASVDVNAADDATLERVPGIGRTTAARIVKMRELNGRFASNDELLDVAGMTQTRLERALPFCGRTLTCRRGAQRSGELDRHGGGASRKETLPQPIRRVLTPSRAEVFAERVGGTWTPISGAQPLDRV